MPDKTVDKPNEICDESFMAQSRGGGEARRIKRVRKPKKP